MSNIMKCALIIEGMIFLGIEPEKFINLKKEHGSVENLYLFISDQLSGN